MLGKVTDCGVIAKNNCQFVEAALWIARTGAPWRDLPAEFGHWHWVYVRYNRWSKKSVWKAVFEELSDQPDLEYLMAVLFVFINTVLQKNDRDWEAQGKS